MTFFSHLLVEGHGGGRRLPNNSHLISSVLELLFDHHLPISMVTKCTGIKGHLHFKRDTRFFLFLFCYLTLKSISAVYHKAPRCF